MYSALLEPGFAVQTRRASLGQPKYIFVVWRGYVSRWSAFWRSARIKPFLDLRMAIHKRNTARAIMIAGRKIHHVSRRKIGGHLDSKPSIVDAVRVLVDKNKTHRGSRINHVRILFVGAKRRCWKPKARAESLTGRHAAHTRGTASGRPTLSRFISRTMINFDGRIILI